MKLDNVKGKRYIKEATDATLVVTFYSSPANKTLRILAISNNE